MLPSSVAASFVVAAKACGRVSRINWAMVCELWSGSAASTSTSTITSRRTAGMARLEQATLIDTWNTIGLRGTNQGRIVDQGIDVRLDERVHQVVRERVQLLRAVQEDDADRAYVRNQAFERLQSVSLPGGAQANLSPDSTPVGEGCAS